MNDTCENTDKTLYTEPHSDAIGSFDDSLFVTTTGGIGIDVAGRVYVKPLKDWHLLANNESELFVLRKLVEAAKAWKEIKLKADLNPGAMLSSSITTGEAAEIMDEYFSKEEVFWKAIDALDPQLDRASGTPAIVTYGTSPIESLLKTQKELEEIQKNIKPIAWEEYEDDFYEDAPPSDSEDQ